jgi:hypothetical protein
MPSSCLPQVPDKSAVSDAQELRYMAENYETMPGRKQSDHLRQAWHYRQQARRFEARP